MLDDRAEWFPARARALAVLSQSSGCGRFVKNYGNRWMLKLSRNPAVAKRPVAACVR